MLYTPGLLTPRRVGQSGFVWTEIKSSQTIHSHGVGNVCFLGLIISRRKEASSGEAAVRVMGLRANENGNRCRSQGGFIAQLQGILELR